MVLTKELKNLTNIYEDMEKSMGFPHNKNNIELITDTNQANNSL
jgi:hypothetical protein